MNHIKNIEIKNFKSIRHQKIEDCRRINVFIGYPNVGKSNILEAIGLYSLLQLRNEHFKFNEICRVKHFSELFYNQDSKETNNIIINDKLLFELIIDQSNDLAVRANLIIDNVENAEMENVFSSTTNNNDFFLKTLQEPIESKFKNIIGSVKKYEFQKNVLSNAQRPQSLAIPSGNNLLDVLQRSGNLRKEIVEIFREYNLKLIIDRIDQSIKFQKELSDGTAVSIPYHQVADTLRRLIFFKAAIETNKESILLFEEPEAHMFPPYISKFTTDIIFDKNENQYFITTHSPFVINDFIDNSKDELAIYVVDYDKGETIIKRLTEEEVHEIAQYGIDLFFNLESYLDKYGQPHSA